MTVPALAGPYMAVVSGLPCDMKAYCSWDSWFALAPVAPLGIQRAMLRTLILRRDTLYWHRPDAASISQFVQPGVELEANESRDNELASSRTRGGIDRMVFVRDA